MWFSINYVGSRFDNPQAQYLVIPVNLWGALVYAIGAYLSDRHQTRFLPLILTAPFGIAGYAILLCPVPASIRYFATYLIATACFLCTGGNIAWLSGNCAPDGKRAASLGILLTLTNIGGVVSGQIYQTSAAPGFVLGHAWSCGCLVFAWCGWWIVRRIYVRRGEEKERVLREGGCRLPEGGMYTDREPDFRYQI
jgi:MFS family permease